MPTGTVLALALSPTHNFSKSAPAPPPASPSPSPSPSPSITLLPNLGIQGDAHCGATVQHRSRLHIRPVPPNLRQVHLIHSELFAEFRVAASHLPGGPRSSRERLAGVWGGAAIAPWLLLLPLLVVLVAVGLMVVEGWARAAVGLGWAGVAACGCCWVVSSKARARMRVMFARGDASHQVLGARNGDEKEGEGTYDVKPGDLGENITTRGLDLLSLPQDALLIFVNPGEQKGEVERPTVRVTGLRNPCPQIDKFARGLRERCLVRDAASREVVGRKAGIMGVVDVGGEVRVGAEIRVVLPEGEQKPLGCV